MLLRIVLRIAAIPVLSALLFAINLFVMAMQWQGPAPFPPLHRVFWVSSLPALTLVVLSVPVQLATRRLVRAPIVAAVLAHVVMGAGFHLMNSILLMWIRATVRVSNPAVPFWEDVERYAVANLPENLLAYAALVAGTLAWDNWRLSVRRERTAARLAAELTKAELSALRSKMQPHFLFNALHGISSVMETDVVRARQMMVALSQLLRSSLQTGSERARLEQEVQFTRDYLDLQHMRFEDRLVYDVRLDARPQVRIPAFLLQPLVENAVIHGMADRSEPTRVTVAVREVAGDVEIDVSDNGAGFPQDILDGRKSLGVGLSSLRARLQALPAGRGTMVLKNRPGGGAQVIVRVPAYDENGSHE